MILHCTFSWLSLQVNRCLSIKGAEDILNKPHAFEVSTTDDSMFFIADTDKVCNAISLVAALTVQEYMFSVSHVCAPCQKPSVPD